MLKSHRNEGLALDWLQSVIWDKLTMHKDMVLQDSGTGEMMSFMDQIKYPYPSDAENETIAKIFKIAYAEYVINEILTPIGKEYQQLVRVSSVRY